MTKQARRTAAAICGCLIALAAINGCQAPVDLEAERAALLELDRQRAAAAREGETEAVLGFWDEEAVLYPPDRPAVIGRVAIAEWLATAAAEPGQAPHKHPATALVSSSGDLGHTTGPYEITISGPGKPFTRLRGTYVSVWRKKRGAWSCVVEIQSPSPLGAGAE